MNQVKSISLLVDTSTALIKDAPEPAISELNLNSIPCNLFCNGTTTTSAEPSTPQPSPHMLIIILISSAVFLAFVVFITIVFVFRSRKGRDTTDSFPMQNLDPGEGSQGRSSGSVRIKKWLNGIRASGSAETLSESPKVSNPAPQHFITASSILKEQQHVSVVSSTSSNSVLKAKRKKPTHNFQ
jgi:hypothetical protein